MYAERIRSDPLEFFPYSHRIQNRRSRRDGAGGQPIDLAVGLRDRSNERAQAASVRNREYNDFLRTNERRLQQLRQQQEQQLQQQQQLPQQRGTGRPPLPPSDALPSQVLYNSMQSPAV